ncbi:FAD-dependent oxidoreductase [Cellulomonas sp. NPDC089187]|uniref:NAD(P)/FAD-dependent oxidoreductase n=1 Tax=Cellulomonas sp. NPDC089187 TaxID=3154970 RepID=UPI00341CDD55
MSSFTPTWRSRSAPLSSVLWQTTAPDRSPTDPLDGDSTAEVVIIGAGASGLWAAWALLDADPALDVLVIDAGTVADGASGRGIGACSAWSGDLPRRPRSRPDSPPGLTMALLRDAVIEVGGTVAAEQIDCDFQYRGALRLARDTRGFTRLGRTLDPATEDRPLDVSAVARRVLVNGAVGGIDTADCATVQPVLLLRGLAEALVSRGARIAEHTRALRISPGAVVSDQGIIRADRIVQATGACSVPGGRWQPSAVSEAGWATEPASPALWEQVGLRPGQLLHLDGPDAVRLVRTADDRAVLVTAARRGWRRGGVRSLHRRLATLIPALGQLPVSQRWSWSRAAMTPYPVGLDADGIGWVGGHGPEPFAAANLSGRVLADLLTGSDTALVRAGG